MDIKTIIWQLHYCYCVSAGESPLSSQIQAQVQALELDPCQKNDLENNFLQNVAETKTMNDHYLIPLFFWLEKATEVTTNQQGTLLLQQRHCWLL